MHLLKALHAQLCEPFRLSQHEAKPGATSKDGGRGLVLLFVDPREYEQRLDDVLGPDAWQVEFRTVSDIAVICRLTILGVVREQVGEEANEKDPNRTCNAAAQSFKRACAGFGLGRYLYRETAQVWAEMEGKFFKADGPTLARQVFTKAGFLPVQRLERALRQAEEQGALDAVAGRISEAVEQGDLTKEERAHLGTVYKAVKADLELAAAASSDTKPPRPQTAAERALAAATFTGPGGEPRPNPYAAAQNPENFSKEEQEFLFAVTRAKSLAELSQASARRSNVRLSAPAALVIDKAIEKRRHELTGGAPEAAAQPSF